MSKHVIKHTHKDGEELRTPTLWCGRKYYNYNPAFLGVEHVALAAEGSVQPCKNCIKAISFNIVIHQSRNTKSRAI